MKGRQPFVWVDGVLRFQENPLVRHLLDEASAGRKCDMNDLCLVPATSEERAQFAQLIGYSVAGYGDLSYVQRRHLAQVDRAAEAFAARHPEPRRS